MDFADVDSFGILEPGAFPEPLPEASVDEVPFSPDALSVNGNRNKTAGRDLVTIEKVFLSAEFAEQVARPRSEKPAGRGLQDPEALERLAELYVVPPGLLDKEPGGDAESALQVLHTRRVVLLTASEHDGGQFAAGLRLGHELQRKQPGLIVREEFIEELRADDLLVEHEPAVVIGDLRGGGSALENVRRGLVEFTELLREYQSYLILIVPYEQMKIFNDSFPQRTHRLRKPSSAAVFAKYFTEGDAETLIADSGCSAQLEDLWPPRAKYVVEVVSDSIRRGKNPVEALRGALDRELDDWTPELRKAIEEKQQAGDAEWLCLLMAAAVLEGAALQHIANAADRMLENNCLATERPAPLLRPSPYSRLGTLGSKRFDVDTREFLTRGRGTLVLQHFWREHPAVHKEMLSWISGLPGAIRKLSQEELELIADRSAELAAEGGYEVAITLAKQWAQTSNRSTRSIAVRLLTTVATHSSLGADVRAKLWEWSTAAGAGSDLQLLTAEVCGGIGRAFPRVALTRLKHLASTEDENVARAVLSALRQIGADLTVSRFLRYLSAWFDSATPRRLHVLAEGVAKVLEGQTDVIDADVATSFWRDALDKMPPEDLRPAVTSWLRTAAKLPPDQREGMVEPLVESTGHQSSRIAQLYYASRLHPTPPNPSSPATDPVDDVVNQLLTRLDEVDPLVVPGG
ncbi:hypothetical protein [Allokutzneria oryzae]|uniref:Uncharacterized protein n=1 Tax=Allokutzneria oryzae TaxID=1378989 RepID=A0ABV5ZX91_9PSEU